MAKYNIYKLRNQYTIKRGEAIWIENYNDLELVKGFGNLALAKEAMAEMMPVAAGTSYKQHKEILDLDEFFLYETEIDEYGDEIQMLNDDGSVADPIDCKNIIDVEESGILEAAWIASETAEKAWDAYLAEELRKTEGGWIWEDLNNEGNFFIDLKNKECTDMEELEEDEDE